MKELSLGTAMWGWSVAKNEAHSILDHFYDSGGRYIDTANNYPINGNNLDFQKSALLLTEWCDSRGVNDLKITFKVGSITNQNTPTSDLSHEHISTQYSWAREHFRENLACIMIHWDNSPEEEYAHESCQYFQELIGMDIEIGLSGIKHPQNYKQPLINNSLYNINIQAKHNFLFSGISHYHDLDILKPKYWAYGISASGLKLSEKEYNEKSYITLVRNKNYHSDMLPKNTSKILNEIIKNNKQFRSLYHIAIAYSELDSLLYGYIVAPSKIEQIQDIIHFRNSVDLQNITLPKINES